MYMQMVSKKSTEELHKIMDVNNWAIQGTIYFYVGLTKKSSKSSSALYLKELIGDDLMG